ncbi:MAG: hisS [Betaproteobacteria bacterium]|jgi:histidyl-tRNA synthetase|nr:hisS [Betaproteobacteria bacterium]MEA3154323.1 histidyl-tRNA synthetase [Betaproteobacteria bacterium]
MNDILPDEAALWQFFEDTVRAWLRSYGYREIRMPILERTELFVRSIGAVTDIVEKEMYTFIDELNGESLTLRPEGTASCVRAAIEHNLLYNGAQRLWYAGPMFRHERPQKGRYRQFHQFGVEALGYAGPDVDIEHILMCARLWGRLGLTDLQLELNTLGSAEARARYRERLVKYLEQHREKLDADSQRRLETNPLRVLDSKNPQMQQIIEGAPRLLDDLDDESAQHFEAVQGGLRSGGIAFDLNPRLVRGLDYYNRTVFEWTTQKLGAQGTVCAGGRYDGLIGQIGGKAAPACGYAMGVERLIALMKEGALFRAPVLDAYVVRQGDAAQHYAQNVAERMRDDGLDVVLHSGGGSFKSQMKKADASGARYAVVIGDDEAAAQKLTLKPLRAAAEQATVALDAAVERMRARD